MQHLILPTLSSNVSPAAYKVSLLCCCWIFFIHICNVRENDEDCEILSVSLFVFETLNT